jgi:hypothetical protein
MFDQLYATKEDAFEAGKSTGRAEGRAEGRGTAIAEITDLAQLLNEAARMYQQYALLSLPHPAFSPGRWINSTRETLERFGYPVEDNTPAEAKAAVAVLESYHSPSQVDAERAARATQAVLDYFKEHTEAGEAPLFHHRDGIAKAVLATLSR